jgi:tRNA(Ile)-lysidine synthase
MQPLGMSKEKKVKDILIDRHIPREIRTQLPLFFSEAHCIWLGGVQLDHRVRLTSQTSSILRLSIEQKSH